MTWLLGDLCNLIGAGMAGLQVRVSGIILTSSLIAIQATVVILAIYVRPSPVLNLMRK